MTNRNVHRHMIYCRVSNTPCSFHLSALLKICPSARTCVDTVGCYQRKKNKNKTYTQTIKIKENNKNKGRQTPQNTNKGNRNDKHNVQE